MAFNPLTTTANDLKRLLESGQITSVEIIETYLSMIERHDKAGLKLNALISVAPQDVILKKARELDERKDGKIRSPLHGVPIALKDNILTHSDLGMPTTGGSKAYLNAKAECNAAVVDILLDAGLVILAKANLTEFCGMVDPTMMPGFSSINGQTLSPYVKGGIEENESILGHSAPGGSSTGSAVAVASGFAPLALGTETVGSIVTPAIRAALYAIKLTVGSVPSEGMFRISKTFDAVGPMAKSADDLRLLADILLRKGDKKGDLDRLENISVGFADPAIWKMDEKSCRPVDGVQQQMVSNCSATSSQFLTEILDRSI
jgi:amidase